jgi:hypothetical protein
MKRVVAGVVAVVVLALAVPAVADTYTCTGRHAVWNGSGWDYVNDCIPELPASVIAQCSPLGSQPDPLLGVYTDDSVVTLGVDDQVGGEGSACTYGQDQVVNVIGVWDWTIRTGNGSVGTTINLLYTAFAFDQNGNPTPLWRDHTVYNYGSGTVVNGGPREDRVISYLNQCAVLNGGGGPDRLFMTDSLDGSTGDALGPCISTARASSTAAASYSSLRGGRGDDEITSGNRYDHVYGGRGYDVCLVARGTLRHGVVRSCERVKIT